MAGFSWDCRIFLELELQTFQLLMPCNNTGCVHEPQPTWLDPSVSKYWPGQPAGTCHSPVSTGVRSGTWASRVDRVDGRDTLWTGKSRATIQHMSFNGECCWSRHIAIAELSQACTDSELSFIYVSSRIECSSISNSLGGSCEQLSSSFCDFYNYTCTRKERKNHIFGVIRSPRGSLSRKLEVICMASRPSAENSVQRLCKGYCLTLNVLICYYYLWDAQPMFFTPRNRIGDAHCQLIWNRFTFWPWYVDSVRMKRIKASGDVFLSSVINLNIGFYGADQRNCIKFWWSCCACDRQYKLMNNSEPM